MNPHRPAVRPEKRGLRGELCGERSACGSRNMPPPRWSEGVPERPPRPSSLKGTRSHCVAVQREAKPPKGGFDPCGGCRTNSPLISQVRTYRALVTNRRDGDSAHVEGDRHLVLRHGTKMEWGTP